MANASSVPGMCQVFITNTTFTLNGSAVSVWGALNSSWLLVSVTWLLWRLATNYQRSYTETHLPLQRLTQGLLHGGGVGGGGVVAFGRGGGGGGGGGGTVLPVYYSMTLTTILTFMLQVVAFLVPRSSDLWPFLAPFAFAECTWNDSLLVLHLARPPGATFAVTAIWTLIPAVAILLYVLLALPGPLPPVDCAYCGLHTPKPGIENAWLLLGLANVWIAVCAEFQWSIVPRRCLRGLNSATRGRLGRDCGGRGGAGGRGGRGARRAYGCVPRESVASWALAMSAPYLCSSVGMFVLHYWGSSDSKQGAKQDVWFCVTALGDLSYTLLYAPVRINEPRRIHNINTRTNDCG